MKDLEAKLKASNAKIKLIITDGVFSMDAEVAPLPELRRLADKYGASICLDDCHATGVIGKNGRGTEEHYNMVGGADIITSTLAKALGGASGGFIAGSRDLIDFLRIHSRNYIYSIALPPSTVGGALKVLQLLQEDKTILKRLNQNARLFREGMKASGFEVKGIDHPICPVMIRDCVKTWKIADHLHKNGVWVPWIVAPVALPGEQKIRVIINAGHSEEDVRRAVAIFKDARKLIT